MKTVIKVKYKSLVLDSVKLFNRLVIVSQQDLSIRESLQYELTALPMSLFHRTQFMRKSNKALLGSHIKSMNIAVTATELTEIKTTVIDGGWVLHQLVPGRLRWSEGRRSETWQCRMWHLLIV